MSYTTDALDQFKRYTSKQIKDCKKPTAIPGVESTRNRPVMQTGLRLPKTKIDPTIFDQIDMRLNCLPLERYNSDALFFWCLCWLVLQSESHNNR